MESVKCYHCGEIRKADELIWQVRIVDGAGQELDVPCCTARCASAIQDKYEALHSGRLNVIVNQMYQVMTVTDYMG